MSRHAFVKLNIPKGSGSKTSQIEKLSDLQVVGFYTDANLVSTSLTFNACPSLDANPPLTLPIVNSATSSTFTVTTSKYYGFTADQRATFEGVGTIQAQGGSNETNGTVITLACIPRPAV